MTLEEIQAKIAENSIKATNILEMEDADWDEYGDEFDGDGIDMPIGQPAMMDYTQALDPNVDDEEFEINK